MAHPPSDPPVREDRAIGRAERLVGWLVAAPHLAVLAIFVVSFSLAVILGLALRHRPAAAGDDLPIVLGHREGCLRCHGAVTGLGASHDPRAVGCSACHLGNTGAREAARAHEGMIRVPGNLDRVGETCGRSGCHDAIAARVRTSLMATMRGIIAVDRHVFGEQDSFDGTVAVADLANTPADTHLRQLCVSCHLGTTKLAPAPITERSRGGGCVACHRVDGPHGPIVSRDAAGFAHPGISVRIPDANCFGCHSRSGRISLNYEGWYEADEQEAAKLPASTLRRLEDGRVTRRDDEDAHHAAGMACIDCHTAAETMGDGVVHLHEEQATRVRCTTCHRIKPARSIARSALDEDTSTIVRVRDGANAAPEYLVEDRSGVPLTNARPLGDGTVEVRGKLDGKRRIARPPARACNAIEGHARLSCQSCHAAKLPRCIGCHTQFDSSAQRSDEKAGSGERGPWAEYEVPPQVGIATLGVFARDGEERIEPFAPGMVLTLNLPRPDSRAPLPSSAAALVDEKTRFIRAYALAVPHTIRRRGRTCQSCHLDPIALGYGAGGLSLDDKQGTSQWRFEPAYQPSRFDGLPSDAWIGFLREPTGAKSTRSQARPLSLPEQRRTLDVGACMTCHDPGTASGAPRFEHYREGRAHLGPKCRVPSN